MAEFDYSGLEARKHGPAPEHTLPPNPVTLIQKVRILLADDSKQIRDALRREIEGERDWTVCGEADNGQTALERAQALHPDLLILDISMPVMNGLEAAQILARIAPTLPILIVSMHALKEYRREARVAGARGYILKPEIGWTLVPAVQAILRNEMFFYSENLFRD